MLSKAHRFHGRTSLRFVFNKGRVSRGPLFQVKVVHNPRRKSYRLAVTISRKVHKSAVARNRMRRRLYETARQLEPEIESSYDIVLTVFSDKLLEATPGQIRAQIKKQLLEVGVFKSPS